MTTNAKPEPQKFRRRPEIVEAVQWRPGVEIEGVTISPSGRTARLPIAGTEHVTFIGDGEWVVTWAEGQRSTMTDKQFRNRFEPVDDPAYVRETD